MFPWNLDREAVSCYLPAMSDTIDVKKKPRKGERAALIRKLNLRYPELSDSELARRAGCSPSNVSQVLKSFLGNHTEEKLRDFQSNTANVYDALKMRFLESVTQAKLAKCPPGTAIISAGILHDKAALLRGQATSMNVNVLLDVAALIRREG